MIEGPPALDRLDLLGQRRVAGLTRRLLDALLSARCLQTESLLAHARLFFDDYTPPAEPLGDPTLAAELQTDDPALRDYYCYVLLDFVTADRELEDLPLAAALGLAEQMGWHDRLSELVLEELRVRKKQFGADRRGEGTPVGHRRPCGSGTVHR